MATCLTLREMTILKYMCRVDRLYAFAELIKIFKCSRKAMYLSLQKLQGCNFMRREFHGYYKINPRVYVTVKARGIDALVAVPRGQNG